MTETRHEEWYGILRDEPLEDTPPVETTQWPCQPCDPAAIHDRYPPVGTGLKREDR